MLVNVVLIVNVNRIQPSDYQALRMRTDSRVTDVVGDQLSGLPVIIYSSFLVISFSGRPLSGRINRI